MTTATKTTFAGRVKILAKKATSLIANSASWSNLAKFSTPVIAVGIVVLVYAISSGMSNYQKFNSPFDEIDRASEYQTGLLPVLEAETAADVNSLVAPEVLSPSAATAVSAAEGQKDYSRLSALSPDEVLFAKIGLETLANPIVIGLLPDRLIIPSLDLYVDIRPVGYWEINFEGSIYRQWDTVDDYATAWHNTSARVGVPGNTVISGHHNVYGKVFENLYTLKKGAVIQVKTVGNKLITYRVVRVLVLEEKYQPLEVRLENARWIQTSNDERLTLVSCWPNNDNSHRVIVVAVPEEAYF